MHNAHRFRETSQMRHCGHRRIAYAYTENAGVSQCVRLQQWSCSSFEGCKLLYEY